jgi:hypothetical protein
MDTGYVPNAHMSNVFMGTAIDTYDPVGKIHPKYKQVVSKRLAVAGVNVAYGMNAFPANGPFPLSITFPSNDVVEISYDRSFAYNGNGTSGFSVCCAVNFDFCYFERWERIGEEWVRADPDLKTITVDLAGQCRSNAGVASGLAYLWEDNPVKEYLGAPIYAADQFRRSSEAK